MTTLANCCCRSKISQVQDLLEMSSGHQDHPPAQFFRPLFLPHLVFLNLLISFFFFFPFPWDFQGPEQAFHSFSEISTLALQRKPDRNGLKQKQVTKIFYPYSPDPINSHVSSLGSTFDPKLTFCIFAAQIFQTFTPQLARHHNLQSITMHNIYKGNIKRKGPKVPMPCICKHGVS